MALRKLNTEVKNKMELGTSKTEKKLEAGFGKQSLEKNEKKSEQIY